jgi:Bacterial archaeo-eukaryotic release factor family 7
MDTIHIDAVKQFASLKEAPAVSIYLPTHLAPDARQDGIRLKNLLERAENQLEARGMRRSEAAELLAPARELPDDAEFWKGLNQGLAILINPRVFHAFRLPLAFQESLTVHQRLHIKPLLPVADYGERFLLLALSQKRIRLLEITRHNTREVTVPGMPVNKRQALNYDEVDRGEQVHTAMRGSLGKQAAVFHGQGGEKDTAKDELEQLFQLVNRALEPVLRKETAPLLLAGVDYLLPIFRKSSSYPQIVERHLTGNCDLPTNQQLHERGWEIMRPYFDRPRRVALEKLNELLGTGRASAGVVEVAGAATMGKIDVLLVDVGQEQPGICDAQLGKAVICDQGCDGSEDLVNLAVAETLLHGGVVHAAEPGQLPVGAATAAIYRY